MKNKKVTMKVLSAIGILSAMIAPIAVVVSCGNTKKVKKALEPTVPQINPETDQPKTDQPKTDQPKTDQPKTDQPKTDQPKTDQPKTDQPKTDQLQEESTHKYAKDVLVSTGPKEITKTFGDGNFANPSLTYKMEQRSKIEQKTRMLTGQPYSLHYHMDDVAQWTAGKDTDDAFNVATIPLHDRELAGKILASQKDKQLQILGALSKNTAQTETGTTFKSNINDAVFQMWSKVTSFVGWGGSASEGNFVVPKGNDINAAHRNGVPLLGTLFLPPDAFGGESEYYDQLSKQAPDGTFPVADKMVEMAQHFGFDGWFLNFESNNNSSGDMQAFMKYFHDKMVSKKLFTVLYDFGDGSSYMNDKNNLPFDEAALDYGSWGQTYAVDAKDRSYGYDYDKNSLDSENHDFANRNLWLYTYFKRHDIADGDDIDIQTFSDKDGSRDPRAHVGDSSYNSWSGLSKYFQAHTTINSREGFSTSFETGIGSKFFIGGEEQKLGTQLSSNGWRNQGVQDILPTYTWINDEYKSDTQFDDSTRTSKPGEEIKNDGSTWKSQIEETKKAFYGSLSLHYTGKILAGNTMVSRLYGSDVSLKTDDEFSVVVQGKETKPNIALWLQDKYDPSKIQEHVSQIIKPQDTKNLGNDMYKLTYKISSRLDGKVMSSFGLSFTNADSKTSEADYSVGQISFSPMGIKAPTSNKITSITPDGAFSFAGSRNVRVNWKMEDNSAVDHYIIWSTNQKIKDDFSKKDILSITSLPAAYLQGVARKQNLNIVIDAVDANNNIISSNNAVVKTTFIGDMSDKTKWSEKFVRQEGTDAVYTVHTGNGYTTAFKDSDGNFYFGDDYTRIHKIGVDGTFKSNGSDSWGKSVSKDFKDKHTLQIFEYDDKNIGVLTADGVIHILDKETGEQTDSIVNTLKDYMTKIHSNKIDSIQFFSMENGNVTIFATGENNVPINAKLTADGSFTKFANQAGNKEVSISKITANADKTVTIAYSQDNKIGIEEFPSVDDVDLTKLTAKSEISDSIKTFVETDFVAALGDLAKSPSQANLDSIEKSPILLTQKLTSGDTLIVNAWGVAMTIGKDGMEKAITSTVNQKTFKEFAASTAKIHQDHGSQGFPGSTDINLGTILEGTSSILAGQLAFDEKTNSLQGLVKYSFDYKYWGHAEAGTKFTSVNLTDLIAGTSSKVSPTSSEKIFSTEDGKKIGGISFSIKLGDVIVMGGSESSIAIFDADLNQLALGEKQYLYDGKVVSSMQEIYNDEDAKIPESLID